MSFSLTYSFVLAGKDRHFAVLQFPELIRSVNNNAITDNANFIVVQIPTESNVKWFCGL